MFPLPVTLRRLTPARLRDDVRVRALALGLGLIPPRTMHSPEDAAILSGLARNARRIVEIGVYEGSSAVALCGVMRPGAELHLVDPFGHHPDALPSGWGATEWATRRVITRALRLRAHLVSAERADPAFPERAHPASRECADPVLAEHADPVAPERVHPVSSEPTSPGEARGGGGPAVHWHVCLSSELAARWQGEVDLVFIDGDHSESGCERDWSAWHPFVAVGGHVVFHDARAGVPGGRGLPGPTTVVTRHFRSGAPAGAHGGVVGLGGVGSGGVGAGDDSHSGSGWEVVAEADRTVAVRRTHR